MKIHYKKKRLKQNLLFAVLWTAVALLDLKYIQGNNWLNFAYVFIAILYWGSYFYEKTNQYLIIENEQIWKNRPFAKRIDLAEINRIKRSATDYILMTDEAELSINRELIDDTSLKDLKQILEELNLPPDKTPFANHSAQIEQN